MLPSLLREASDPETPHARLEALAQQSAALCARVAANPGSPPALLEALARFSWTARAAAANPSTPLPVLQVLLPRFPREVWQNPSFSLSVLAEPQIVAQLSHPAQASLIWRGVLSNEVLGDLVYRKNYIASVAARYWRASEDELLSLTKRPEWFVREAVCDNPSATEAVLLRCVAWMPAQMEWLLSSSRCTPRLREALLTCRLPSLRSQGAARWSRAARPLLRLLWRAGASPDLSTIGPAQSVLSPPERDRLRGLGVFALELLYQIEPPSEAECLALADDLTLRQFAARYTRSASLQARMLHERKHLSLLQNEALHEGVITAIAEELSHSQRVQIEVYRGLASHPTASPALVAKLALHEAPEVRAEMVASGRLPPERYALLRAAGASPDLREVTGPCTVSPQALVPLCEEGQFALLLLLHHPDCPADLLHQAARARNESLVLAALRHPALAPEDIAALTDAYSVAQRVTCARAANCPPAALRRLATDVEAEVRRAAACHPAIPPELLALLRRAGAAADLGSSVPTVVDPADVDALLTLGPFAVQLALQDPSTTEERLAQVLSPIQFTAREPVEWMLIRHPRASDAVLGGVHHPDAAKQTAIASHPNVGPARLLALSSHYHWTVRAAVAAHPSAPPAALLALAQDERKKTRLAVAAHPNTPPDALVWLAQDRSLAARRAVASNRATPAEVLAWLAASVDDAVSEAARENPSLAPQVRAWFTLGPETAADCEALAALGPRGARVVASFRGALPGLLDELCDSPDLVCARAALANPSCPRSRVEDAAGSLSPRRRAAASKHPGCPPPREESPLGRYLAASRAPLTLPLGWALAGDAEARVRRVLAARPDCPEEVRAALAGDPDPLVRASCALYAPEESLTRLACDARAEVRRAVARNPAAPRHLLLALAGDARPSVRRAAARRLSSAPE